MLDIHLDRTAASVIAAAIVIAALLVAYGAIQIRRSCLGLRRVLVSLLAAIREGQRAADSEPPPPLPRRH